MGLFGVKKPADNGEIISFRGTHSEGLGLASLVTAKLQLFPDKLIIEAANKDKTTFEIPKDRLVKAEVMIEQETFEKDKSVMGRAIVGGLLLGPVGAVVGGISGTGKKTSKKPPEIYLLVDYINSEGKDAQIAVKNTIDVFKIHKFVSEFNKLTFDSKNVNGTVVL
jgi:hypothetical protein